MAKKLINEYVFNPGLGIGDNARPNAVSLITQNKTFIIKEIVAYIQNLIDAGDPDYTGYTYNTEKCERDAGYVIDALIFDLRYGGNEETRRISSLYWDNEVPQIDGSRIPEYESYQFARDLINNFILTNIEDTSPEQLAATQVIDLTKTTEANTTTRVTSLLNDLVSVIQNGLGSLPALVIGLGRVEILGKISLKDILIITNVTDNVVIYNFAEPTKGGQVTFRTGNSESYPQAESVNNGTTIINFNFSTSSMSSSDIIQIFLEETELSVRLNTIATDAMERIKVGIPQAMLDADFEYGLQPTKWQALAFQRGYPSVYEVPASDINVTSATTDASTGTSGIGGSLITVTTQSPHGLVVGNAFTIRALASSILGFNRAEGTFIVNTVPSTTTFTYYAKSKVGTSSGQVLASSNTQLRKADFYTGSSIEGATFSIASNGSSGTFTTTLAAPSGSSYLTFTGILPPNGAPLTGTGISTGTQVSGGFGSSNSDGLVDERYVSTTVSSGATSIVLNDVTGIVQGMAISDGAGTPTQLIISSVVGNTLNLSGALQTGYTGDNQSYSGIIISQSNYITGTGTGATFDVTVTAGVYDPIDVNTAGSGYLVGDTLRIIGTDLGGASPANDLDVTVSAVDESGGVVAVKAAFGTDSNGTGTGNFTNVASSEVANTQASNGNITITKSGGSYTAGAIANAGTDFNQGNRFLIPGTDLGGASPANDAIVVVDELGGEIQSFSVSGTSVRGDQIGVYATISLSSPLTGNIAATAEITYSSIATIQVDFDAAHGLIPGGTVTIVIESSGSNHQLAAGPYFISTIPSATRITYIARSAGTIDTSSEELIGSIYPRPDAFFSHRPYDGGVQLGTGGPQHGSQAVRMSKKYIRYQSGKGAMYNTGALFAPNFDVLSITAAGASIGSLITIALDDSDHGLQAGATIRLSGVLTTGYNGDYLVSEIVDERTFKVLATTQLGSTTAVLGSQCTISTLFWHGAIVRSGPFDEQNGLFWQYDGNRMAVGRRTSTFTCAGTVAINANSNAVTGTNTRFLDQLQEGDRIVVKGMTHVVTNITNNTSMAIAPAFRGVNSISAAKISKIEDLIIPQEEWNLDRCDGTGPSGYEIDVTKMQMIGIQFTWYGAGFIDWMLRGPDGNYVFCHRLKGNNLNTEAYMRTGNLPVRYEVINESARSRLNGAIDDVVTTLTLSDVTDFPNSGVVYVDNELIQYTGRNVNNKTLTGCTRGADLQNFAAGSTRTYTAGAAAAHNDRQGVILVSNTTSPIISHWGSAYLIDGQFDEDRGYIFNYAATGISISTVKNTAFLIRLAPSVSNAVIGDLGERELLNRAQLLLQSITVTSNEQAIADQGGIVVEGVLNPSNYPTNPSDVVWAGLQSQAGGGQPSFAQIASGGSVAWPSAGATTTTATVQGELTGSFTAVQRLGRNNTVTFSNGSPYVYISDSEYDSSGIELGDVYVSNTGGGAFGSGAVVDEIIRNTGSDPGFTRLRFTRVHNTNVTGNQTLVLRKQGTASSYTGVSSLFFTQASWESSGAGIGTPLDSTVTSFPSNTRVTNVQPVVFDGTTIYRVTFNQTSIATVNAAGTITFNFTPPPFALPGEQVFSFISRPGETNTLDLGALKELTTTAIGGRGAFPNGPDVLAITVYKVAGAAVTGNIILRWGEAQA